MNISALATVLAGFASALAGAVALAAGPEVGAAGADAAELAIGRALYMEGKLPSGAELVGYRAGGLSVRGAGAACVNCHRRSGLGGAEGRSFIPPVTATYLFTSDQTPAARSLVRARRGDYDEASLARAVRDGHDPAGRQMDYLMPRYALADAEMKVLIRYLRNLSAQSSPGAGERTMHFATVVTPAHDPGRRQIMLDVLRACFAEHNAGPPPERGRRRLGPGMGYRDPRRWTLDVWQLEGDASTWPAQLEARAAGQPPFALIAGLGAGIWSPVHAFCEARGVPCLFPAVEVPPTRDGDFYSVYWSRGVLLEADLIAHYLAESAGDVRRVAQLYRVGDGSAQAAAEALQAALAQRRVVSTLRSFADAPAAAVQNLVEGGAPAGEAPGAVVLWLRDADLGALVALPAPSASPLRVLLSATLGGWERSPLPAAWKSVALMAYPRELPDKRLSRDAALLAWLRSHRLPAADTVLQADTLLACRLLGDGLDEIGENLYRDYFIERLEGLVERRPTLGFYPRLAIGPGQRVASKSGYIVRFAAPEAERVVPVTERLVP